MARVPVKVRSRVKTIRPLTKRMRVAKETAVAAETAAQVAVPVATVAGVAVAMARPRRQVASVSERPAVAGARQHRWRSSGAVVSSRQVMTES